MSRTPRPGALTLGTRASSLARAQTEWVRARLEAGAQGLELYVEPIVTTGDRTQASGRPLPEIGGKGLFTQELEQALRSGVIDVAVHSLKDLPTEDAPGLAIGAVCEREDARDCLVSRSRAALAELAPGATVGTSSLRRAAQLRALRPDLEIGSVRGNVDTRVRKALEGELDAVVLAAAGVLRLGLEDSVAEWLPFTTMLPAPGQGALAVQCREGDTRVLELLERLDDPTSRAETTAERAFLRGLGGGCAAPVAALAVPADPLHSDKVSQGMPRVHLQGLVASLDGREVVKVSGDGVPEELGARLAHEALAAGADGILEASRGR